MVVFGEIDMSIIDKLIQRLKEVVGEAHLIEDPDRLKTHAIDGKKPKAVVLPGTIDEISKVVSYANEQSLAVIPTGNGTKIGIGGIPKKADILLSTNRLNRMTDCDCDNLTLTAESGTTLAEVQKRLAKEGRGYFLPLDPPFTDRATIGGIVATNSSGPKRLLYGTARDLVIGTKAVAPNGDIVVSGGKTVKNVSGYDMSKLLIGSYGTLGILCEITFKLLPLPEKEATLLIPFTTLKQAVQFVHEIMASQLLPASIETLNGSAIKRMRYPAPIPAGTNYLVAIGLEGVAEGIDRQVSEMAERGKGNGGLDPLVLHSEKHHSFWVALRDFTEGLNEDHAHFISSKSNFLIFRSGEMIEGYEKMASETGMDCALICHSGSGILYSYVFPGKNLRLKVESLVELIRKFTSEAVKNEGNLIMESSPLLFKKKVDVWGEARGGDEVMRRLKEQIDPKGILNPGRFVGGI